MQLAINITQTVITIHDSQGQYLVAVEHPEGGWALLMQLHDDEHEYQNDHWNVDSREPFMAVNRLLYHFGLAGA